MTEDEDKPTILEVPSIVGAAAGSTVVDLTATEGDIVVAPEALEPPVPQPPCHVMLDLETWGTGNNAAIISIGACKFTEDEILDSFHVAVDPTSCKLHGLDIDPETIMWWMSPDRREALDAWLNLERVDLASALLGFDMWCKTGAGVLSIWGNGSTFDNVILRSAYKAVGQEYPVRFWQDACYRTVKNRTSVAIERTGIHHNALDDAVSQAKHLQAIWRKQDAAANHLVKMQAVVAEYLPPDSGISQDEFVGRIIELLDGPEQRAVQG